MDLTHPFIGLLADFWQPARASTVAGDIDWLFYLIYWICVFFFFLILILVVTFCWKYRYREGYNPGPAPKHNTAAELTWTFIPTVIVIFIFYYGFKGYLNIAVAPPNSYEIVVDARTWSYSFVYPTGHIDNVLHVPAHTPVQMILSSEDVIHGFYIPEFRLKKDIVPGRYNKLWFQSDLPDTYDLYCTQYCGQGHSQMRSTVVVMEPADFRAWLDKATEADNTGPPAELGKKIYLTRGCAGCHTIDGSKGTGPTWKNIYGYEVTFENAPSTMTDEAYIRSCILNPSARIVKGFANVMPSFQGVLKDRDIDNVIAFIKTLSDKYHPEPTTRPANAAVATTQPSAMPSPAK
jgi:cytochrome c oxidase subunit 2